MRKSISGPETTILTPADCRVARAILRWSQAELAERSDVLRVTIARLEQSSVLPEERTLEMLRRVFETAGLVFCTDARGNRSVVDWTRWVVLISAPHLSLEVGSKISLLQDHDGTLKCADLTRGALIQAAEPPRYGQWTYNYGQIGDQGIVTLIKSQEDKRRGSVSEVTYRLLP